MLTPPPLLPPDTRKVIFNITPDLLERVDAYATSRTLNRSTAIRLLLQATLDAKKGDQ
jgi:metal-responsive CopG/Arc/MetJ family transcriptional regulator